MQPEPVHVGVAPLHTCPQMRQSVAVPSITSHVLVRLQSAIWTGHNMQKPAPSQTRSCVAGAQTVPQAPQFVRFLNRLVSQPFAGLESQLPQPAVHVNPHVPAAQVTDVVFGADGQTRPHIPQFAVSLARARQIPEHIVCPAGHAQTPAWHVAPPMHERPHTPQFAAVLSGVSQPSLAMLLQFANPGVHSPTPHVPAKQAAAPFGGVGQTLPHVPQLRASVMVFVQAMPHITGVAPPHVDVHVPPEQTCPIVHVVPHIPQLPTEFSGVSQPSPAVVLQSPKPVPQAPIAQTPSRQTPVAFAGPHGRSHAPQ